MNNDVLAVTAAATKGSIVEKDLAATAPTESHVLFAHDLQAERFENGNRGTHNRHCHTEVDEARNTEVTHVKTNESGRSAKQSRPSSAQGSRSRPSYFSKLLASGYLGGDDGYHRSSQLSSSSRYAAPKSKKEMEQKMVFADATAMKAKILQNLIKEEYNVQNFYHTTGVCQAIARNDLFDKLTLGVICVNALWIAIDTDENDAKVISEADLIFQVAENSFCAFFTFEWFVRFMSFKRKRNCLRDFWFIFDSCLVSLMVMETWVMVIIMKVAGIDGSMGDLAIIKLFRLMRLSRIARMARILRSVPELMILIKGISAAVRSVFFTLVLLALNIYVFAIFFTQLCSDSEDEAVLKYFSTVWTSAYTLLLRAVLLDSPALVSEVLGKENPFFAVLFFIFILMAALTVMNMLIGVLCEVVCVVAAVEKEQMMVSLVKSKLQHIVEALDENGDNLISRTEFLQILENREAATSLQEVGVDVVGLIDFADFIFDNDGSDNADEEVELSFPDFMEVVLSLRGSNTATVKDVVDLRKFVRTSNLNQNDRLGALDDRMGRIENNLFRIETLLVAMSSIGAKQDNLPCPPQSNGKTAADSEQQVLAKKVDLEDAIGGPEDKDPRRQFGPSAAEVARQQASSQPRTNSRGITERGPRPREDAEQTLREQLISPRLYDLGDFDT